ncbi:MAG: trypsin-like peptidase domain-containing protein [Planctomycetota bacterium]
MRFAVTVVAAGACGAASAAGPIDGTSIGVGDAEENRIALIERLSPTVLTVMGAAGGGGGSGVLIDADGHALTNFHVVQGVGPFLKCGRDDGELYDAVVVGLDPGGDVALIKLAPPAEGFRFPFVGFGDSDGVRVGDPALVMGNPFLFAEDFTPSVSFGIVSGVHRYQYPDGSDVGLLEYADCLQVDAAVNPGNSGGPLFDADGRLVGINGRVSFEKRVRINSGVGYAISINQIKKFMGQLRGGRLVDHATIGATVRTERGGEIVFDRVRGGMPADRRGVREGDTLVSFAGRPIRSVNQFQNVLGIFAAGQRVSLTFRPFTRAGEPPAKPRTVAVRLAARYGEKVLNEVAANPPGQSPPAAEDAEPPAGLSFRFRPGFANYFANEQETGRVLALLEAAGFRTDRTGPWRITGRSRRGESFAATLADTAAGCELGAVVGLQPLGPSAEPVDEPPGTGGLLTALHHLRLLGTRQTDSFATFGYFGTADPDTDPLLGRLSADGPLDVLVAENRGTETRFYVSRRTGRLAAVETTLDDRADPCRIEFLGPSTGRPYGLADAWRVSYGPDLYAELKIEDIRTADAGAGEGSP